MSTIKDVADRAGVSTSTVSHVVNGTRYVSPDLAGRVWAAIESLNYQPNALARSLRNKQTRTLGMIIPDNSNPFFAEVARGIEDLCFELGYNVILCNSDLDPGKERKYIDLLMEKQVDGIVFVSAGGHPEHILSILERRVPVVEVDRELDHAPCDRVLSDNRSGGRQATEHLISRGHSLIACISGPSDVTPSWERVVGYREALSAAGHEFDESLLFKGDFRAPGGYEAMKALLTRKERPTAVFACNDLMAIGALRAATEQGLSVPRDIAVVGFDDVALASFTNPPLTTVAQARHKMGRLAAEVLVERISGNADPPRLYVLETTLIVRGSS